MIHIDRRYHHINVYDNVYIKCYSHTNTLLFVYVKITIYAILDIIYRDSDSYSI